MALPYPWRRSPHDSVASCGQVGVPTSGPPRPGARPPPPAPTADPPEAVLPSRLERGLEVRWTALPTRLVRSLVAGTPRDGVPELVVVPGLGALGYLVPTVRACAAWTRVHLLDVPGFGSRRTARLPADLTSVAATVSAWLAEAGLPPVTLLGHSTGAQAVLRAGVQSPDLVARLVLAGATFAPRDRAAGALLRDVGRTLVHERPGELPAVLPYYVRGARGLPVLLRSALADRPEDRVGQARPPVLVLHGRHDRLCPPAWAGALAEGARDGRALVLPGAHNVVWTSAGPTAEALRAAGT